MEHSKKVITGAMVIVIFVLIVSMSSWYVWNEIYFGDICSCALPLPILIPVLASVGLLAGTVIYYIFSPDGKGRPGGDPLVLMEPDERAIMKVIISNGGKVPQSRIVEETGLSKVKVFRTIEKLKRREIICKEKFGKTNNIKLCDNTGKIWA